jgi:hypothetical protein
MSRPNPQRAARPTAVSKAPLPAMNGLLETDVLSRRKLNRSQIFRARADRPLSEAKNIRLWPGSPIEIETWLHIGADGCRAHHGARVGAAIVISARGRDYRRYRTFVVCVPQQAIRHAAAGLS